MPKETSTAVKWALSVLPSIPQSYELVDKVREYFNTNKVTYNNFSYDDLKPYLI